MDMVCVCVCVCEHSPRISFWLAEMALANQVHIIELYSNVNNSWH